MKRFLAINILLTSCLISSFASAEIAVLNLSSTSFQNNQPLAEKFAYCAPDGRGKTRSSNNLSPTLTWSGAPKETKSYAIVMFDPDVPASFDDANKDGKTLPDDAPRQNFYHWVVTDIPVTISEFREGAGKDIADQASPYAAAFSYKNGGLAMVNDYASFMKDKPAINFLGYDGPCPPFNDLRLHHYHFMVYALDVPTLGIKGAESGKEAAKEIEKHALAKGELVGTFTNYVK